MACTASLTSHRHRSCRFGAPRRAPRARARAHESSRRQHPVLVVYLRESPRGSPVHFHLSLRTHDSTYYVALYIENLVSMLLMVRRGTPPSSRNATRIQGGPRFLLRAGPELLARPLFLLGLRRRTAPALASSTREGHSRDPSSPHRHGTRPSHGPAPSSSRPRHRAAGSLPALDHRTACHVTVPPRSTLSRRPPKAPPRSILPHPRADPASETSPLPLRPRSPSPEPRPPRCGAAPVRRGANLTRRPTKLDTPPGPGYYADNSLDILSGEISRDPPRKRRLAWHRGES